MLATMYSYLVEIYYYIRTTSTMRYIKPNVLNDITSQYDGLTEIIEKVFGNETKEEEYTIKIISSKSSKFIHFQFDFFIKEIFKTGQVYVSSKNELMNLFPPISSEESKSIRETLIRNNITMNKYHDEFIIQIYKYMILSNKYYKN